MHVYTILREKYITRMNLLMQAIFMFAIGSVFVFHETLGEPFLINAAYLLFLAVALWQVYGIFFQKIPVQLGLVSALNYLVLAILLYFTHDYFLDALPWFLIVTIFAEGIGKYVTYRIYKKDQVKGKWYYFFTAMISILFFLILLFKPLYRLPITYIFIGIYFLMQGLVYLYTLVNMLFYSRAKKELHIALPVMLSAILPMRYLKKIEKQQFESLPTSSGEDYRVEVLIHMSPIGFRRTGHCDLVIDGMVYSYGSYDFSTFRFGAMLGEGVLFQVPKKQYIPFVQARDRKTLIGYGLHLNHHEVEQLKKDLQLLSSDTIVWEPMAKQDPEGHYVDYASALYKSCGAKFWKFRSGELKTYFVLGSNCTTLVDKLLGKRGISLINVSGIVTPGSYLEYMESHYEIKNSRVIARTIYIQ